MSKTIAEILGSPTLTGTIQAIKPGIPRLMPDPFFAANRTIEGDSGTYTKIEGTRQTARLATFGSPARRRGMKGVSEVPIKLAHSFEVINHKPTTLLNLRNYENESKQRLGRQEIARATADFAQLFTNWRTAMVHSAFALGAIYFDGEGNLLPSSSGAVYTIDFGIPAGNKTQLDVFGDGDIIAAAWDVAATDIVGQIEALKIASLKKTGYALEHAFYGENVLGFLINNDAVGAALQSHPALASAFMMGEIPNGFLGLQWHPMGGAFFADENADNQTWWPADQVVFSPTPTADWYEVVQGTYPIPADLGGVYNSGDDAIGAVREVAGMFSYAKITDNPVGIEHYAGDTVLPVIKVPNAVFIADVDF